MTKSICGSKIFLSFIKKKSKRQGCSV